MHQVTEFFWGFFEIHDPLDSLKRASRIKPATGFLLCCHQVDIRMRSHRLLQIDDNKSAASCQQACCKLMLFQQLVATNIKLQQV